MSDASTKDKWKDPTNESEALQTLADFARTAPGRLPGRVEEALKIAGRAREKEERKT